MPNFASDTCGSREEVILLRSKSREDVERDLVKELPVQRGGLRNAILLHEHTHPVEQVTRPHVGELLWAQTGQEGVLSWGRLLGEVCEPSGSDSGGGPVLPIVDSPEISCG